MSVQETFVSLLHQNNTRLTQHAQDIFDTLKSQKRPLSAVEIYEMLSDNGSKIDLSTVHRTMERFCGIQVVQPVYRDKATLYELSHHFVPHHHHFTCTQCETIYEIDTCVMDVLESSVGDLGEVTHHSVELFGICNRCV